MTYPFNNKEEYLAYRKMWKAEYKELSQSIRDAKLCRKIYQREWNRASKEAKLPGLNNRYNWSAINKLQKEYLKNNEKYQELWKKYNPSNCQYWTYPNRDKLKVVATRMLKELKDAKVEAQRQFLERHQLINA